MTQAVQRMTACGIGVLKRRGIFAQPYVAKRASARALEKAGFQREGTLRANVFKDGQVFGQYLYSTIAEKEND